MVVLQGHEGFRFDAGKALKVRKTLRKPPFRRKKGFCRVKGVKHASK